MEASTLCTPSKKRGPRDLSSLQPNSHEKRFSAESQQGYYKSREYTVKDKSRLKKRAKISSTESWASFLQWKDECVSDDGITISIDLGASARHNAGSLTPGMAKCRRYAIQYFFVQFYGTPPEDVWDEFDESRNIPTLIMHHVGAPKGSYASIIEVLRQCLVAHDAGECYDPSKEIHLKTVHLTATSSQTLRAE